MNFRLKSFLEILRPLNCLMSAFAVLLSGFVASGLTMDFLKVFIAGIVTFLFTGYGNVLNDYFDYEIDCVNRPHRVLPRGDMKRKTALYYSFLLVLTGSFLLTFLNSLSIIIAMAAFLLITVYSMRLKKTFFWVNLVVSYLSGLPLIYGGAATGNVFDVIPLGVIGFSGTLSREIAKDIEDVEGDRKHGAKTIPVVVGVKNSGILSSILLALAIFTTFTPYFLGMFGKFYLILAILVSPYVFRIVRNLLTDDVKKIGVEQRRIKFAMNLYFIIFLIAKIVEIF